MCCIFSQECPEAQIEKKKDCNSSGFLLTRKRDQTHLWLIGFKQIFHFGAILFHNKLLCMLLCMLLVPATTVSITSNHSCKHRNMDLKTDFYFVSRV